MRRLWAGFYEAPPIFLFALLAKGGPAGASLAAVAHRTLDKLKTVVLSARIFFSATSFSASSSEIFCMNRLRRVSMSPRSVVAAKVADVLPQHLQRFSGARKRAYKTIIRSGKQWDRRIAHR